MAPPRTTATTENTNISTAYSLSLLSEYTHALDSLPLDLSRNFADLRELDAVLSSSMTSITTKIQKLVLMIEENTSTKDERLWLLSEIAEEATRLKLGGEDKIRVACQAADNLRSHTNHMRNLLEHLPGFDPRELKRRTTYPHIASKAFLPVAGTERGRGRRGGFGSILSSTVESPAKRKRVARDDDGEVHHRSPRKDKAHEGSSRHRNPGGRTKKNDRAASPTESMISVTSMIPAVPTRFQRRSIVNADAIGMNIDSMSRVLLNPTNSRRPSSHHASASNAPQDDPMEHRSNGNGSAPRREAFNAPPTSAHNSLPHPFSTSTAVHYEMGPTHHLTTPAADWANHPPPGQLEGPGMPVSRSHSNPAPAPPAPVSGDSDRPGDDGDGEPEDTARYCYCNGVSYGEMIGCDGPDCELEWFHIGCVGMQSVPNGSWFCDGCKAKKPTRSRGGRGGKKKGVGGRSAAKAVAN